MTVYEIFFIIFAVSFALDEYTASREHGWNSKFRNSWDQTTSEFITSPISVYLANVRCFPMNNGSALRPGVNDRCGTFLTLRSL